jgi:predicted sugar kinase
MGFVRLAAVVEVLQRSLITIIEIVIFGYGGFILQSTAGTANPKLYRPFKIAICPLSRMSKTDDVRRHLSQSNSP